MAASQDKKETAVVNSDDAKQAAGKANAASKKAESAEVETKAADQASADVTIVDEDDDLESEDSLTFSNGVIEKIVAIAMRSVPGVVGMKGGFINRIQETFGAGDTRKGVTVEVTPESSVKVNVAVLIEYGSFAPQVFEDVKKAITKQVTGMTGLQVAGVNLRIEDVLTAEEIAERRNEEEHAENSAETPLLEGTSEESKEGTDA